MSIAPLLGNTALDGKRSKAKHNDGRKAEEEKENTKGNYSIRKYTIIIWPKEVETLVSTKITNSLNIPF